MSKYKTFHENLLNLIEEEVLCQTEDDLLKLYGVNGIEDIDDFKSTKSLIDNVLTQHKKNKLIVAREKLEIEGRSSSDSISQKKRNAKDFIIDLMLNDRIPEGLTIAFREGEDIPDDEIESIIEDLRDLGLNIDDE